jgi:dipeptidyl aminopeptidase/acylaminoacyl peptidase
MVLLIHGGSVGAWLDSWGYRWNPQMWQPEDTSTVLINPHGSTGYGQALTEEISGDRGGAVYEYLIRVSIMAIATATSIQSGWANAGAHMADRW